MLPIKLDYPVSVAVLYYAGNKDDDKDTMEAVKGIIEALVRRGHIVRKMEVNKNNWRKSVKLPGDVVFNLVEDDTWDLYMKVGLRLEELGRAQVGQDMKSFKYVINKAWIKQKMKKLNISTPNFRIFNRRTKINQVRNLEYPVIIKPSKQHAGLGISQDSVVIDQEELVERVNYLFKNFPGEVVAEEYIDGREIHCTLIGNGRNIVTLPYCEIGFKGEFNHNWNVYTYEAKWDKQSWEYWDARVKSPIKISKELTKEIERLSIKAYKTFGCRDVARMDMRINEKGKPMIIDVNMNPSLNYYDLEDATLASVRALKWGYDKFIETIVAITYKRVYGKLPDRIRARQLLLEN